MTTIKSKTINTNPYLTIDGLMEKLNAGSKNLSNYRLLAYAVIFQAVQDYQKILLAEKCNLTLEPQLRRASTSSIEKFFHSEWFDVLSGDRLSGDYMIEQSKRQVDKMEREMQY